MTAIKFAPVAGITNRLIFFSLLLIITLASCNNAKHTMPGPEQTPAMGVAADSIATALNGTWELNYITGPRIAFNGLYPNKKPLITFKLPSTEANGHTSCNSFGCNFTIAGNKINFADPRSTKMACEGGGEQVFLKTLKQVTSYSINDSALTFIMGDIAMMRFVKK